MRRQSPGHPLAHRVLVLLPATALFVATACGQANRPAGQDSWGDGWGWSDDESLRPGRYDWGQHLQEPSCLRHELRPLHVAPWPGLGLRMIVSRATAGGNPLPADQGFALTVTGDNLPLEFVAQPVSLARSYLLLLLGEATDEKHTTALGNLLDGLLTLRPELQVAIFRRGAELEQVVGFTNDPYELHRGLADLQLAAPLPAALPLWSAVAEAAAELTAIGGGFWPAHRFLVAWDDGNPGEPVELGLGPFHLYLLSPPGREPSSSLPFPALSFAFDAKLPEPGIAAIVAQVNAQSQALVSVGSCPGLPPGAPFQVASGDLASCSLTIPAGPAEEQERPCDQQAVAGGEWELPTAVRFLFTPEERELHDAYAADKIEAEFTLAVQLGDSEPVAATAHFRGQTSLDCARKSYTVNLKGKLPRLLAPESASDRFLLISMCKDDRYFQQHTANLLAHRLGLFPLEFNLVELLLGEESRGVYLLLERPDLALLEDRSRVTTVIRRRFDPESKPVDVKYPSETLPESPALAGYYQLVGALEGLAGKELLAEIERRLNLDLFLDLVAFHSLTGNGDWVDELYFYATEAVSDGISGERYFVMAWDMDDLYSACHHSGKHAMADPFGLLYCAEGNLEKRLLADPLIYERFVQRLERLLQEELTEAVLDEALAATADRLLPFFDRPEICAAMVELLKANPDAKLPEVARKDLLAHIDELRTQYRERAKKLTTLIAAYRKQSGGP